MTPWTATEPPEAPPTCAQCGEAKPLSELRPLERHEFLCDGCAERNCAMYERMLGESAG